MIRGHITACIRELRAVKVIAWNALTFCLVAADGYAVAVVATGGIAGDTLALVGAVVALLIVCTITVIFAFH